MAQICSDPPRSGGKILDDQDTAFGLLSDSTDSLANPAERRNRLESDGYLYLKRFFNPADILDIRKGILARMLQEDLILPGSNPLDATANPDRRTAFMPELAENNLALEKLI